MPNLAAIYRSPTYSPAQHASNDTAILDATVAHFAVAGWTVHRFGEDDVVRRAPADMSVCLNMCQGRAASEALRPLEEAGVAIYNRPSSVLSCHRHRLVPALARAGILAPGTTLLETTAPIDRAALAGLRGSTLWVKRGDVHAERPEDVVAVDRDAVPAAIEAFRRRDVERVAVQEHVDGVVCKFYGLADGSFFEVFRADTRQPIDQPSDRHRLREIALRAAAALRLDVFGGDFVLGSDGTASMIDLNDWPSFAPVRDEAARAIATMVLNLVSEGMAA